MTLTTEAQTRRILQHLESGKSLTGYEALMLFDCMRLPARISELKEAGVPIKDSWEYECDEKTGKVVKKWKRYWIS